MENHDIEIGMTVVGKLYLHCVSCELPTAFDISRIKEVLESELGGAVVMYEEHGTNKYDSSSFIYPYVVEEKVEDINSAIKEATSYKDAALETINSLLKNF